MPSNLSVGAPPTARSPALKTIAPWAALLHALLLCITPAHAMGNHPEANTCPPEKPYYAVCTAGSHDLQGWTGKCRATKDEAQRDADEHARDAHAGVTQWSGVARTGRGSAYGGSGGLQP